MILTQQTKSGGTRVLNGGHNLLESRQQVRNECIGRSQGTIYMRTMHGILLIM